MVITRFVRSPQTLSLKSLWRKVVECQNKAIASTFVLRKVCFGLRKVTPLHDNLGNFRKIAMFPMGRQGEAQSAQEGRRPARTGNSHFLMVITGLVRSPETFLSESVWRKVVEWTEKAFGSIIFLRKVCFGLRKVT